MWAELVGQPSLLTETIFARVYLDRESVICDSLRRKFIKHGWREAIEEGLKEEYPSGGKGLWLVITKDVSRTIPHGLSTIIYCAQNCS